MNRLREKTTANLLIAIFFATMIPMLLAVPDISGDFDQYGYNYNARIFNGIYENWYREKYTSHPAWQEGDPYLSGIFGPAHLVMKWNRPWDDAKFGGELWSSGARVTNDYKWVDPDTGERWHWYYRIVVAPKDPSPSDDAEDVHWGYPVAEDGTVLCFWAIFRVESGFGPYVGPATPNGPGAYK